MPQGWFQYTTQTKTAASGGKGGIIQTIRKGKKAARFFGKPGGAVFLFTWRKEKKSDDTAYFVMAMHRTAKQQDLEEKRILLDGKFKAMIGKVDGLLDIRLSKNVNGGPYDWALEGLFCSMEAVKGYQTHPLHLEIQQMAKDWVTGRACVDVETEETSICV